MSYLLMHDFRILDIRKLLAGKNISVEAILKAYDEYKFWEAEYRRMGIDEEDHGKRQFLLFQSELNGTRAHSLYALLYQTLIRLEDEGVIDASKVQRTKQPTD